MKNDEDKNNLIIKEYYRIIDSIKSINDIFLQQQFIPIAGIFVAYGVFEKVPALAIIFPFFLLYNLYNTIKYTVVVLEYSAYATFLEEKINKMFSEVILIEITHFNRFNNKYVYGGVVQLAFHIPIIIFSLYFFYIEIQKGTLNNWISSLLILFLIIAIIVIIYLSILLVIGKKQAQKYILKNIFKIETDTANFKCNSKDQFSSKTTSK